jgi:hypothetical protein
MRNFTGLSGGADYTRVGPQRPRTRSRRDEPYTFGMKTPAPGYARAPKFLLTAGAMLVLVACGGSREDGAPSPGAASEAASPAQPSARVDTEGPDTRDMGPFILAKINANPEIGGKATLVEFRQKSVATEPLGDKMKSAVVEFEGVVTFSSDVAWSWQGPTKAGEPQKFEARAEYVDNGNGWQLVEPLGIYPL